MAQSRKSRIIMNMVYGLGAAIVILGVLFKMQHISYGFITGGLMLTVGLIAESIVFIVSAFEPIEDSLDWTKVYPELGDLNVKATGSQGMLSQKLDNLLKEAHLDKELISGLGDSIRDFKGAAEGLSAVSETILTTNKYNDQMSLASVQMESLNGLYQIQMENATIQKEINNSLINNSEKLKKQMESLATNLNSLNEVYGGMLSAMSNKN